MKKLNWPPICLPVRCIYRQCAYLFTVKTSIKDNALKYQKEVDMLAKIYPDVVPHNISKLKMPTLTDDEKADIVKLYDQKFSKQGEMTRKYYDVIFANGGKTCPICGVGKRKNLDHFLPKSKYPLLCVTPLNLIPTCRDCNMDKGASSSTDYYDIPFNPYFDETSFLWLSCKIEFDVDGGCIPTFGNGIDKSSNPDLYRKCKAHITQNNLDETFQNAAINEIEDEKKYYKDLLNECGEDEVKKQIQSHRHSSEKNDINSWKSALYRALELQCHEFCEWLTRIYR